MYMETGCFHRSALLLGESRMTRLREVRVIIFGVGGVGSWCAESLIRTGLVHLTLVDSDMVCASNCNRQMMATPSSIGQVKVEAMRERLLCINPDADIVAIQRTYNAESSDSFNLAGYDFVIDAIDSLRDKIHLIQTVTNLTKSGCGVRLFSSMGAALRVDPTKVRVAEFWSIKGDALARALRDKFKRSKQFPACKFQCVYSEEIPVGNQLPDELNPEHANGSLSFVTGTFGMTLASLVISNL